MQNFSMFSRFNWIKKTSMAKAFCEIVSSEYATLNSFHMETQFSAFYGVFNFEAGKAVIKDDPLVKSIENEYSSLVNLI